MIPIVGLPELPAEEVCELLTLEPELAPAVLIVEVPLPDAIVVLAPTVVLVFVATKAADVEAGALET